MTFDDINFTPHECGGIKGKLKVNEHTVSVLGGFGFYSEPRENLTTPNDFDAFEVAVFAPNGDWATQVFFPDIHDDVIGWQTRDEINELIKKIQGE